MTMIGQPLSAAMPSTVIGTFKYDNVRIGMNSRLDTIQAAVLLAKMDAFIGERSAAVNEVARRYDEALAGSGLVLPRVPRTIRVHGPSTPRNCPKALIAICFARCSQGAGCAHHGVLPQAHARAGGLRGVPASSPPGGCSVTERLCATVLSLPMGPYVGAEGVGFACSALLAYDSLGFDV